MDRSRQMPPALIEHLVWLVPAAFLVWHALRYSFVTDDAYISFVYARNLAEHGELVFNLGDPVEGYSNFLWTVTLGLLMVVGIPPEISSQVLGIGFGIGTLWMVARLFRALWGNRPSLWDAVAPTLLALSAGYACWSSGGLETQMFTFWVTASLYYYVRALDQSRSMLAVGAFAGLAALTRPEGLLLIALLGLHRLMVLGLRDKKVLPGRHDWLAAAIVLALVVPHLLWRWWYYGYPLPNTYYVKAAGQAPDSYHHALWQAGWHYVWRWSVQSGALFVSPLVLIGALAARLGSPRFAAGTLSLALCLVYIVYTASVGGDFMGLYRFLMPLFVVVAVCAACGLRFLSERGQRARWLAALLAAGLIVGHGVVQARLTTHSNEWGNWSSDNGIDTPAFLKVYTSDRARIGAHMKDCFRPEDFSIVGGAGAQPYYGRMRSIDVFGLVSEDVAHKVAPNRPRAGHNKWAPDSLLAELDPDFVFSCYSIHRDPKRPRLNCSPSFWRRRGFQQLTIRIPGLSQQGEYYTFLARKDRAFECPGLVDPRPR